MIFEQLNEGFCKTYLIKQKGDNRIVLIDPVLSYLDYYLDVLAMRSAILTHVIDTHTHADHISACAALVEKTNCQYLMHESAKQSCVTMRVKDGDNIKINNINYHFIHTPGHTSDSLSIIVNDKLLTGDFLFLDESGAGRSDLPGGDPSAHFFSLKKILKLSDDLIIYPAHEYRGSQPSSLGMQKQTNPQLKFENHDDYVNYLNDLRLGPADWMIKVLDANRNCSTNNQEVDIPLDTPACEVKGTLNDDLSGIKLDYIDVKEFKVRINKDLSLALLLDIREFEELSGELGHINGIWHIPVGQLIERYKEIQDYMNRIIIVICRTGNRAITGAQILKLHGFKQVYILAGGMVAYRSM